MFFQSNKKWAAYQQGDFTFLEKNKVHQRHAYFDIRFTKQNSKVQIEQSIQENNQGKVSSHGEVKFEFPFNEGRSLFSRFTSAGKIGVYFDNGDLELKNGQKINFYAGLQSNRHLSDNVYKIGVSLIGNNWQYSYRIRFGAHENTLLFHTKGSHHGKFNGKDAKINFFSLYNPRINRFIKSGILFGIVPTQSDSLFLRVESGKRNEKGFEWQQLLKDWKLNWTKKISSQVKIGAETRLDFGNWEHLWQKACIGGQWAFPQSKLLIRSKISTSLALTTSFTHDLQDYGAYSFAMEWSKIGQQNLFKFGTAVTLNL